MLEGKSPIPRRSFGRYDDQVSIIGLGGYHLGKTKTVAEAVRIVHRLREKASDGRFELYKTSAEHEGEEGRRQHGFPSQEEVAL